MSTKAIYKGRFAPSPTGPLHIGSLVAAVGSYLQARSQNGKWLLRIEDLDPPREVTGAADSIIATLARFGFEWDETITYQSKRSGLYLDALDTLKQQSLIYPCSCSRKQISETGPSGAYGPIYSGRCRNGVHDRERPPALRVITHDTPIRFIDQIQGEFSQNLAAEIGDYVLRRADNLFAYQLAVVIDDADQDINEIVRGSDLLDNTPRQIHLQQLLKLPTPTYMHLPVVLNTEGQKLSKQSGARSIEQQHPQQQLITALEFLNQQPPAELVNESLTTLWLWAIQHWRPERIAKHDSQADM